LWANDAGANGLLLLAAANDDADDDDDDGTLAKNCRG